MLKNTTDTGTKKGNKIAVSINPEGVVISQAGVERSKTPAIVAILYMNPEGVAEQNVHTLQILTIYHSVTPLGFILWFGNIRGLHSVSPPPVFCRPFRTKVYLTPTNCYCLIPKHPHLFVLSALFSEKPSLLKIPHFIGVFYSSCKMDNMNTQKDKIRNTAFRTFYFILQVYIKKEPKIDKFQKKANRFATMP